MVGATSTNLYAVDSDRSSSLPVNKLYLLNPPNAGTLTEVGVRGLITPLLIQDLDIGGTTNRGYSIGFNGRNSKILYSIDLTTGRASELLGGLDPQVVGLAVGLGF
jgi:hypothetical protein